MYDPSWHKTDPSTAAIIKLIEEKERNEAKYGDETKNWDIMRLRDASVNETSRYVEHDPSTRPWPGDSGRSAPAAAGSWRRGIAPPGGWGAAVAHSHNGTLRAHIKTVEWKLNRQATGRPDNAEKRDRSRSVSGDRRRKRRQSRSRSGSRSRRRTRSRSRGESRVRSGSRETRWRRSVSRDRKPKKRDRQRSSSNDSGKRLPSPRKHTKITQPKPDTSATAEILSQFMTIMNYAKANPAQNDTRKVPDHNVLPEFDPNNKGHAIVTWLIRVDDVAKLFGWNEMETLQYSLPKLVGDARTWYQTLATVPFSWAEWKKTLVEQFPCPNFAELLMEMSSRHALPTETLEQYFHAKVVLLNRCGFKGRQAVDCLVQGVETDAIRLCAHAAQFAEPAELLVYLKSAESLRQISNTKIETLPPPETSTVDTAKTEIEIPKEAKQICYKCGRAGHKAPNCRSKTHQQFSKIGQISFTEHLPSENTNPTTKTVAFAKTKIPKVDNNPVCYTCGRSGHKAFLCRFNKKLQQTSKLGKTPAKIKPGQPPHLNNNLIQGPQSNKPHLDKTCYKCQKIGHLAYMCRKNKKEDSTRAGVSQDFADSQPAPPGLEN